MLSCRADALYTPEGINLPCSIPPSTECMTSHPPILTRLPHLVWPSIQDWVTLISYWCFLAIFPSSFFLTSCWKKRNTSVDWQWWPTHPPLQLKKLLLLLPHFLILQRMLIFPSQVSGETCNIINIIFLLLLLFIYFFKSFRLVTSAVLLFLVWRCSGACSSCGGSSWHDRGCCCLACSRLLQRDGRC